MSICIYVYKLMHAHIHTRMRLDTQILTHVCICADTSQDVALPQDVDLLFIDTFHAFSQLRRELRPRAAPTASVATSARATTIASATMALTAFAAATAVVIVSLAFLCDVEIMQGRVMAYDEVLRNTRP